MEHVMDQVASLGLSPISKAQPKQMSVQNAARALFAEFGKVDNNPTRVILSLVAEGMTCSEYDQAEQQALAMAKQTDEASGWQAPANAKGRDKYGPKQSSMASAASNRRQVFGAAKLSLQAIISVPESGIVNPDTYPAFSVAYKKAHAFLSEQGITWDGKARSDVEQAKKHDQEFKAQYKAEEQARKETPKEPGETYQEWEHRCKAIAKDILADIEDKAQQSKVDAVVKALLEKHGLDMCESIGRALLVKCGYDLD